MTEGHKHRTVRVKSFDTRLVRALRKPLTHTLVMHPDGTWNRPVLARIDNSRYPYGICPRTDPKRPSCYYLSMLGILHRWTGLTLEVVEDDDDAEPDHRD